MKILLKIFMRIYSLIFLEVIPSDNIVLIANGIGTFDGSPKMIFLKSKELQDSKYKYYWIEKDKSIFKELSKKERNAVYAFSLKGLYLISRAYFYVVSVSSQDIHPGLKIPKNRVMIQTWHGIPMKEFCKLAKNVYTKKEIKKQIEDCFNPQNTYILVSSDYEMNSFIKSCDFPKERILKIGHPRYDDMNKIKNNRVQLVKKEYKKIILYSPTFREDNSFKLFPFYDMKIENFNEFLLEKNYLLIIKVHPLHNEMLKEIKEYSNIIKYNREWKMDNFELFTNIDLLISDYSSIALDFLLTNKPVAYIQYDLEKYNQIRPIKLKREIVYPGPSINSYREFIDEVEKIFNNSNYYKKERENSIKYFFEYNNFLASKKVFKFIERYPRKK